MKILIVIDHPNNQSFTHAAAAAFEKGARQAGHEIEVVDLHAEGFDPRWSMADIEHDGNSAAIPDVAIQQARIEAADALCLAFPLYWHGMPAMTKGWIDRVWAWNWAYDQLEDRDTSLLKPRPLTLLVPTAARRDKMEPIGIISAFNTVFMESTFGYFGLTPRRVEFLFGAQGSEERRTSLLEQSFKAGLTAASFNG